MVKELPYKRIRTILKEHTNKDVTREGVTYVKMLLDTILLDIAVSTTIELDEENRYRRYQNQPELKRIPVSIFKRISERVLKEHSVFKSGKLGVLNRNTNLSQASEVA